MCVGGLNKAGNGWLDSDTLPLRLCMVASEAVSDRNDSDRLIAVDEVMR